MSINYSFQFYHRSINDNVDETSKQINRIENTETSVLCIGNLSQIDIEFEYETISEWHRKSE